MKNYSLLSLVICAGAALLPACTKEEVKVTAEAAAPSASPSTATSKAAELPKEAPKADPAVLARGDYLVNVVMNCAACHTPMGPAGPDMAKRFAGGLEITEPFGTWRSPNITQDKKTGIGGWTDEQIATAIREGKRPNGDQLFPIMPYPFYHSLSDADVKAVVAFLRTIPAMENTVAGNTDLKLPKVPMPKPKGEAPAADPVAQGAYYSTIMHCGQCHTPMDEKTGAPQTDKLMSGGQKFNLPPVMGTGDLFASNITPDKKTGIGSWSDDDITNAMTKLKHKDGAPIFGPMALLGMNWSKMEAGDLKNVVTWLHSLKPIENKVAKSTFKPKGPPPGAPGGSAAPSGSAPPAGSAKK
jgi:mono/diheme cytochrome c family protein